MFPPRESPRLVHISGAHLPDGGGLWTRHVADTRLVEVGAGHAPVTLRPGDQSPPLLAAPPTGPGDWACAALAPLRPLRHLAVINWGEQIIRIEFNFRNQSGVCNKPILYL